MIKVLIVDDSSFMRVNIRRYLEIDPNIKVVGIARNGIDAIEKTIALKPDVITMDMNMPKMSGITAVEHIMEKCPTPIIMISSLTRHGAKETIEALNKGAIDYIDKNELSSHLLLEKIYLAKNATFKSFQPKTEDHQVPKSIEKSFSIVGIGISTGGPRALSYFMPRVSPDINAGILIAQHMPPTFTQSLAQRLDMECKIRVKEAEDQEPIQPGYAYICPGGMHMVVKQKGIISLLPKKKFPKHHFVPSADLLMASISEVYGANALCIIMTGMGSDGLEGVKIAKKNKSYIIAQSQNSSTIYGMPKAIISNNLQDEILHLNDIGNRINQLCGKDMTV